MYVIGLVVGKLKPELENSVYLFLTNNIFMSPQLTALDSNIRLENK